MRSEWFYHPTLVTFASSDLAQGRQGVTSVNNAFVRAIYLVAAAVPVQPQTEGIDTLIPSKRLCYKG